ncbi:Calcipressin [Phellopilus nigrolimitatus]|nr:Calcipressin [Phellopilus nigrolimitatus]
MASSNSTLMISPPPTPPLSNTPPVGQRTNSLVVTGLTPAFFHPLVLDVLREHFAAYGEVYAWAPVRAFARVILVFYSDDDAESAKLGSDGLTIEATSDSPETVLRVYRADPTPIPTSSSSSPKPSGSGFSPYHLRPPAIEKNFLISPPGSPPVGWEPIREEPPNNTPLAEDLIMALRKLQVSQERDQPGAPSVSVLIEPEEGPGVGVYVEDCGDSDSAEEESTTSYQEEGWFYSGSIASRQLASAHTMRPPMPASV